MSIRYLTENEVAIKDRDNALKMMEMLLEEGYVVMMSREEDLYILNWVWTEVDSDRNYICFNHRDYIEEELFRGPDEGDED